MLPLPHAFAAFYAGMTDLALVIADAILGSDPNCADAHLCAALVHLQRNEIRPAVNHMQKCVASRSVEWVLEKVRAENARHPSGSIALDDGMILGAFFRSRLEEVAPLLPHHHHRANGACINVVGTSFVRSFGGNSCLFPLFIGMGASTMLLTEDLCGITQRKFVDNLKRIDTRRPTILSLGAETGYYARNHEGLRPHHELNEVTDADRAVIAQVAENYRAFLLGIQKEVSGPLMLLGAIPSFDDVINEMSYDLHGKLAAICDEIGVTFLDWWDDLVDPETKHMYAHMSANAYPNDNHLTLAATGMIVDKLKALGVLDENAHSGQDYEWSHVFECQIEPSEKTRIWPEPSVSPNNAFQSDKIALSFLGGRFADLLVALLANRPLQSLLIVNATDAWLPAAIPPQVVAGCVALTHSPESAKLGQIVLDFYGRSDVSFMVTNDESLQRLVNIDFTYAVVCLYPDSYDSDLARARQVLNAVRKPQNMLVMTPFPDRLPDLAGLGFASVAVAKIGIRHIPAKWHEMSVAMFM